MAKMVEYLVGATRVVERPWPTGVSDTETETREVPEGMIHAVDSETGQALCGYGEDLIVLDTSWEETWTLSHVGGPERCSRCLTRSMTEENRENVIRQIESYLAAPPRPLDDQQRLLFDQMLQLLREEPGGAGSP